MGTVTGQREEINLGKYPSIVVQQIYCDRRLGDVERWLFGCPEDSMVVPDEIRMCVCFLGYQTQTGEQCYGGTAFFVTRPLETLKDRSFGYLVTARHVIEKIKDARADSVLLRLNLKGHGAKAVGVSISEWAYHPTDPTADIAIMRFNIQQDLEHKSIPIGMFATKDVIKQYGIDVGDELFFPGLFHPHKGEQRNIPIVRIGNIAAMPAEKVSTKIGNIEAYLVEARSIGGLSGSPVFVNLGGMRHSNLGPARFFLLGLMHGHFGSEVSQNSLTETINMGIGIVVPIEVVMETINHPKFRLAEDQLEKLERERELPKMDY